MKENIVVVGGYGQVGRTISQELAKLFPGMVYAAGRRLEQAKQFCWASGGTIKPLQLDINEKIEPVFWENIKMIVMCLDQKDLSFVHSCLENGTYYVDISADHDFLSKVETLHGHAVCNRTTAILSVGLAPGLTNLMALYSKNQMESTDAIDISMLSGLGDQHGTAAVEWTIDNLGTNFYLMNDGNRSVVGNFSDGKTTDFGADLGKWKAYRFNFSDQHTLMRTLDVPRVATRLCFDSRVLNKGLKLLKATGLTNLLKIKLIRNATVQLFNKVRFGKETIAIKIDAWGKQSHKNTYVECFMQGKNEAEITGKVAAVVGDMIYRSQYKYGVYHIDQLFELASVLARFDHTLSMETRVNDIRI